MSAAAAARVRAALAELRADYERELPARIAELAAAVHAARRGDAPVREAMSEAHKMRGTGGSLGLDALSTAAGELEDALEVIDDASKKPANPAWEAALRLLGVVEAAARE